MKTNLEALEQLVDNAEAIPKDEWCWEVGDVPTLRSFIAELRAARAVVEAVRAYEAAPLRDIATEVGLLDALAAYDKVVGS